MIFRRVLLSFFHGIAEKVPVISPMKNKLTESEISALVSANENGQINIPCGSACGIETFRKNLINLEKMGFVRRKIGTAFYRPFQLTETGKTLKSEVLDSVSASAKI